MTNSFKYILDNLWLSINPTKITYGSELLIWRELSVISDAYLDLDSTSGDDISRGLLKLIKKDKAPYYADFHRENNKFHKQFCWKFTPVRSYRYMYDLREYNNFLPSDIIDKMRLLTNPDFVFSNTIDIFLYYSTLKLAYETAALATADYNL